MHGVGTHPCQYAYTKGITHWVLAQPHPSVRAMVNRLVHDMYAGWHWRAETQSARLEHTLVGLGAYRHWRSTADNVGQMALTNARMTRCVVAMQVHAVQYTPAARRLHGGYSF